MKAQFKRFITGSFVLAILLLGLIGVTTDRSTSRLIRNSGLVAHTREVMGTLEALSSDLADAETGLRGYVITGQDGMLEPYRAALPDMEAHLAQLRELTRNNSGQSARAAQLEGLIRARLGQIQETIRLRAGSGFAAAQQRIADGAGSKAMDGIRRLAGEMRATEDELLRTEDEQARRSARNAFRFAWAGTAASIAVLMVTFYLLKREIGVRERAEAEVRGLNRNLAAHAAQLEAANKELEGFTYSVSHDLRAPLRHVNGFVELLQKEAAPSNPTAERYIKFIADAARHMGSLIDDLLEFSRMGRAELSVTRVKLGPLARQAREEAAARAPGRQIEWKIGELPQVRGDFAMLRAVLAHLVSNAVKFTGTRERAEIEIGSRAGVTEHEVFVRDNGVGFDMKYAGKLFGVFQRLHHHDEFEGTGIGLASVRRIILRHGGRTWAEGAPGRGATFWFSLPKEPHGQSAYTI